MKYFISLLTAIASTFAVLANAAEIKYESIPLPNEKFVNVIVFSGEVIETDAIRFRRLIDAQDSISAVIFENSPGGDLEAGIEIGKLVREQRLPTVALGYCASACGLAWLGGDYLLSVGEEVAGFHAVYVADMQVSSSGNAIVGGYLSKLGYGQNIIRFATEAQPEGLSKLSSRDARLMGLKVRFVSALPEVVAFVPHFSSKVAIEKKEFFKTPIEPTEKKRIDVEEDAEQQLWSAALAHKDQRLIEAYITLYPNGRFREQAEVLLISFKTEDDVATKKWYFAGFSGLDFWGGDLSSKGIEVETVKDCANICLANTECKLFTYNARFKTCFPKATIEIGVKDGNAFSGVIYSAVAKQGKKPPPPVVKAEFASENGVSFTGFRSPFVQPSKSIDTLDKCVRYCRSNQACDFLSYEARNSSGKQCKIWRNRIGGKKKSSSTVSFRKINEMMAPTTDIVELNESR